VPKRSCISLTKSAIEKAVGGQFLWDAQQPGFGVRVTKAGTRTFVIQYRLENGKQGRLAVAKYPTLTVEEARAEARKKLAKVAQGCDPSAERQAKRAEPTLRDRAEHYWTEYGPSRDLKASTLRDAQFVLEKLALPTLGGRKISEITPDEIERVHGQARQVAGPYQANRMLAYLSRIFSLAIRATLRPTNPCKGIAKFPEDQRWRNFAEDEVANILRGCDSYRNQNQANGIRLLLFTGARLQEVVKAEWAQFDLERGMWEKPSSHTKTKRQHRVQLDGPALVLVRRMREQDPNGRYLFPGRDKVNPANPAADPRRPRADLKDAWDWVVEQAKLVDARPHDLRRTTASFMLDAEVPLATIGKALGHTQVSTTARYAQLRQTAQSEALRKVGERMMSLVDS